jgi:uncharacterized protein
MSNSKLLISVIFAITITNSSAFGASFNCTKSATTIEKLICNNQELSQLDDKVNKLYHDNLAKTENKPYLTQDQRRWLGMQRNICKDVNCLKQAYESRITALSTTIGQEEYGSRKTASAGTHGAGAGNDPLIHPKALQQVICLLSDQREPVVTEINLDAVKANSNQFNDGAVKVDGQSVAYSQEDEGVVERIGYRYEQTGNNIVFNFFENDGGTLTRTVKIVGQVAERDVLVDKKMAAIKVLRILEVEERDNPGK